MTLIDIIGWTGAILLATCGIPQAYKSIKTKDFRGLSIVFIIWWGLGELLTLLYIMERAWRLPLLFNYGVNIIMVFLILGAFLLYAKK